MAWTLALLGGTALLTSTPVAATTAPTRAAVTAAETAAAGLERYEYRRVVFGVEARLVFYTTDEKTATLAAESAWRRFEELDAALSDWRVDSELSLLREAPVGEELPVGRDLWAVLSAAERLHAATQGAFDVTVGPYVALWREARRSNRPPGDRALAEVSARVGFDKLRLLPGGAGGPRAGRVVLTVPGMALDLGGIAKGYAAQQVLAQLALVGVNRALVEVGGDIAAGDAPPDRDGWDTLAGCGPGRAVRVSLVNRSLAVSGDTEQFLEVDGLRYSHVLDPRTGRAVTHRTCATVVAEDGATADALASAVQVLGPRDGRRVVHDVVGARLLGAERLDLPLAQAFRDPLRVAPRLEVDLDAAGGWDERDGELVGRLVDASSSRVTFPAGANWTLELEARGEGADLVVHPDASRPGADVVRLPVGDGVGNHWEVRCSGFDRRLQVWRDGELVQDVRLPSARGTLLDEREVALSMVARRSEDDRAPRGDDRVAAAATNAPIGTVHVAGLRLRRLQSVDAEGLGEQAGGRLVLTAEAAARGWKPLLDLGLTQWEDHQGSFVQAPRDYLVKDGVLHVPSTGGGSLRTKRDYRDFRLRFEFRLAPGANSGLFLRGDRAGGDPAYSGCEIQIIDDHGWEALAGFPLQPRQKCGSLYAAVAADAPGALRPTGEWNTCEVLYSGTRLAVALNGRILYDVDTHELECDPPFADRAPTGFIGLQRYGAPHVEGDTALWVRNMFVRELQSGDALAPDGDGDGDER